MLGRGGGESAKAKGGAWESVVEDGELVVGGSTVCVGREAASASNRPTCARKFIDRPGQADEAHSGCDAHHNDMRMMR